MLESVLFRWSRNIEVEGFAYLKWGMFISIYCQCCASNLIATFLNKMKCVLYQSFYLISLYVRKHKNAKETLVLKDIFWRMKIFIVCSKALKTDIRIKGVIGSIEYDNGFIFWNPCKKSFTMKCCVTSEKFLSWKLKLKADTKVL